MRTPLLITLAGLVALIAMPLIITHLPTAGPADVPPPPPPATWAQP